MSRELLAAVHVWVSNVGHAASCKNRVGFTACDCGLYQLLTALVAERATKEVK